MFANLDTLDLHSNSIGSSLSFSNCFSSLKQLRLLNLSNNIIEDIELNVSLPLLCELNLRQNKIKNISITEK